MPMLIIAWYITEYEVQEAYAVSIANYLLSIQDPNDGGWSAYLGGPTVSALIAEYSLSSS